jgi:Fe/S biogenesis protein NfuA
MEDIVKTIEQEINPLLKLHSGVCEAVSFIDGILSIRLQGGCVGCPASKITLAQLVMPLIQDKHPSVKDIVLVV